MQVTCFGFPWEEVRKRPHAQAVVDEMILTDDIVHYAVPLPEGLWRSDSASQHFAVIEELGLLAESTHAARHPSLPEVRRLLAEGPSIDELGIAPLTDDCYYISLSPETVRYLAHSFAALDLERVAADCPLQSDLEAADLTEWLAQWRDALRFIAGRNLGLIGHCG